MIFIDNMPVENTNGANDKKKKGKLNINILLRLLATISVVNERYREVFDIDIMNMLLERIKRQLECDIVELFFA